LEIYKNSDIEKDSKKKSPRKSPPPFLNKFPNAMSDRDLILMRRFLSVHLTRDILEDLQIDTDSKLTSGEVLLTNERIRDADDAMDTQERKFENSEFLQFHTGLLGSGSKERDLLERAQSAQYKPDCYTIVLELLQISQEAMKLYSDVIDSSEKTKSERAHVKKVLRGILCWVATHSLTPSYTVHKLLRFRIVKMNGPIIVQNAVDSSTIQMVLNVLGEWEAREDGKGNDLALELLIDTSRRALANKNTSSRVIGKVFELFLNTFNLDGYDHQRFLDRIVAHPNSNEELVLSAIKEISDIRE
jgi:hypothetical protein